MNNRTVSNTHYEQRDLGNTAVNGLIAGAIAGVIMLLYLLLTVGYSLPDLLVHFSGADMQATPLLGLISHLAYSALCGMIFAILWRLVPGNRGRLTRIVAALVFAILLFVFSVGVLLPAIESPMLEIPTVHWAVAHVVYGITLGFSLKSAS